MSTADFLVKPFAFLRRLSAHRILVLCGIVGLLIGCVPPPRTPLSVPRTQGPRIALTHTPLRRGLTMGSWPTTHWWRRFHNPTLTHLIDRGLQASGSLKVAMAHMDAASAALSAADDIKLPTVDADGSLTRERASASGLVPPPFAGAVVNYGLIGVAARYDLSWWDRRHIALQAAVGQARAAQATAAETRLIVSTLIASKYFRLEQATTAWKTAVAISTVRQHLTTLMGRWFHAGIISAVRYDNAQTANALARSTQSKAALLVWHMRLSLAALVGRGPQFAAHIPVPHQTRLPLLAIPKNLSLTLLARRPDIRVRYWQVASAAAGIGEAASRYYPDISLTGTFAFDSIHLGNLVNAGNIAAAIGPALHLPLFNGAQRRARLSESRARYNAAVARYNATIINAAAHVARAIATLSTAHTRTVDTRMALHSAQASFRLAQARFQAGINGVVPEREAQLNLLTAEMAFTTAREHALLAEIMVIKALGGGYHTHKETS